MILASSYVSARRKRGRERVAATADVFSPGASSDFVEAGQNPTICKGKKASREITGAFIKNTRKRSLSVHVQTMLCLKSGPSADSRFAHDSRQNC